MRINTKFISKSGLLFLFSVAVLSTTAFGQKEVSISAVQGEKNISPLVGESVKVAGIVTARTRSGFFLQTPDT